MSAISNIIEAIRRIGSPSEKSALRRQDSQLEGLEVVERGRTVANHDGETATGFRATVEPYPEQVSKLTQAEIDSINISASRATLFFQDFGIDTPDVLDQLDMAFENWQNASDKLGYAANDTVEILGASFGNYCNATLAMDWASITDQFGVSTAIDGTEVEFRAFPFDSIRKRITDSEYGFFRSIYVVLADQKKRSRKREHAA
jgi:hypothetical protein